MQANNPEPICSAYTRGLNSRSADNRSDLARMRQWATGTHHSGTPAISHFHTLVFAALNRNYTLLLQLLFISEAHRQTDEYVVNICTCIRITLTSLFAGHKGVIQEIWSNAHETRNSISLISYAGCLVLSSIFQRKFTLSVHRTLK